MAFLLPSVVHPLFGLDILSELRHLYPACSLIPQVLHPALATASSNSSHILNFGLPLLLSSLPPCSVQKTFFARSLSSILITCPPHLSLISCSVIIPALYLRSYSDLSLKARLHGSPRLINTVESTKANRVNRSFQRK